MRSIVIVREITLFPFRYFDLLSRKWIKAHYVATLEELAARYDAFQIVGKPEIRRVDSSDRLTAGHLVRSPGKGLTLVKAPR
jgi:hypothetical protein